MGRTGDLTNTLTELFSNSTDGVFAIDTNGHLTVWNEAFETFFDLEISEPGDNIFDVLPFIKGSQEESFINEALDGKSTVGKNLLVPNGSPNTSRHYETSYSPITNDSGGVNGVVGIVRDVTHRKKQTKSEAYKIAAEDVATVSPLAMAIHCEGKVVFANRYAAEMLGYSNEEEMLGEPILQFIHPDCLEVVRERMKKVLVDREPAVALHEKLIRRDGVEIEAVVAGLPYEYEGKPAIQNIIRDVTSSRKAEEQLKRNEKLFHQLFSMSPLGIVMLDENYRVAKSNDGFTEIFGYSPEEMFGKKLNEVIVPEIYQEEASLINETTGGGKVRHIESIRRHKDGKLIPVLIYGVPVRLDEEIIGIYGIYVDISKRKQAEEQLRIRNEELDHFVYKVSHDLRAPLTSLLGLINLTKLGTNQNEISKYIELMEGQINQMDGFIRDILSHAKNLKQAVSRNEIDFQTIIESTFGELDHLPQSGRVQRKTNISGEAFYSDKWRIEEIFRNLISNAIKYSDPSKKENHIHLEIVVTKTAAVLKFADNGIGIASEFLPHIYDMFYRATESSVGSGLGLYIVKNAVHMLEGEIKIESRGGEGTCFEITIPNLA